MDECEEIVSSKIECANRSTEENTENLNNVQTQLTDLENMRQEVNKLTLFYYCKQYIIMPNLFNLQFSNWFITSRIISDNIRYDMLLLITTEVSKS